MRTQLIEIEKEKAAITSRESEIELKQQEIAYLSELPNLDPIILEHEQRIRDKQFQTAQIQGRLDDVDNASAQLAQVKAPYSGTVRRVKWLGQSPDGSLTAEVTLMVKTVNSQQSTVNSEK